MSTTLSPTSSSASGTAPTLPAPLPSARAIPLIVRRHAEEAATRWWRRGTAYIGHRRTEFDELLAFDQTIDDHLDGLLESGPLALDVLARSFSGEAGEAPDVAADFFAAYAWAVLTDDPQVVRHVLQQTDANPAKAWALDGVLSWQLSPLTLRLLQAHLQAPDSRLRAVALAQCSAQGYDGGEALAALLMASEAPLLARALQTAGECGRRDLLPQVEAWCQRAGAVDPLVRFRAACASVLLGSQSVAALDGLRLMAVQPQPLAREALRLLCVCLPEADLAQYLQQLAQIKINPLLLLEAIGWSGNVGYASWLIEQMRIPARARMAGEAFRLITGFDFEAMEAEVADVHQEGDVAVSPDDDLTPEQMLAQALAPPAVDAVFPLPDVEKVAAWWQANQRQYDGSPRLLLGAPVSFEWLDEILEEGEQAHRELAALWRVMLRPGSFLVPTAAHALLQWQCQQNMKVSS